MKALLLTICLLALAFTAYAADVTLTRDANTETDLAGYRVYQGNGSEAFEYVIKNLRCSP